MKMFQVAAVTLVFVLAAACASVKQVNENTGGSGGIRGTGLVGGSGGDVRGTAGTSGGSSVGCQRLQCQKVVCPNGGKTTVSGKIYDPAGRVPLYNVMVYVPNAPLAEIPQGVSCQTCDGTASGSPVASALSDASGSFVLDNVPVGPDIPLVIQVGKWRRQVTIPNVAECTDTPLTDKEMTRLPRTQAEGHIPLIALSTGHSDALDCLLRKIGIADSEFTNDSGGGRVHMYRGGGASTSSQGAATLVSGAAFADSYATLFPNYTKLAGYDILILQCEGSQLEDLKTPHAALMKKYADNGGRIFAEHLHSVWFRKGAAPWPATATWIGVADDLNTITGIVDTSFPKGVSFADWLMAVGASTVRSQVPLVMAQHSVDAPLGTGTRRWISTDAPASVQYLTFNTPVETAPENQCGRAVFTDVHVGVGAGVSHPETPFPSGCTASLDMSPQEKALEFMFFDLSSCVMPDMVKPKPPVIE